MQFYKGLLLTLFFTKVSLSVLQRYSDCFQGAILQKDALSFGFIPRLVLMNICHFYWILVISLIQILLQFSPDSQLSLLLLHCYLFLRFITLFSEMITQRIHRMYFVFQKGRRTDKKHKKTLRDNFFTLICLV